MRNDHVAPEIGSVLDNRITQTRMTDQFNEPNVYHGPAMPDRGKFLGATRRR